MMDSKLSEMYKDGLKEIGNIGAGNASKILSDYAGEEVDINISDVDIISLPNSVRDVPDIFDDITGSIVGTIIPTEGVSGGVCFLMTKKDAQRLLSEGGGDGSMVLDSDKRKSLEDISENLIGKYLDSICDFISIDISHASSRIVSMPKVTLMAHIASSIDTDNALVIKNNFVINHKDAKGDIIFLLGVSSVKKITNALEDKMM